MDDQYQFQVVQTMYPLFQTNVWNRIILNCDNLKKLLETVDPMDIDFNAKVFTINNLKYKINSLHLRCLDEL